MNDYASNMNYASAGAGFDASMSSPAYVNGQISPGFGGASGYGAGSVSAGGISVPMGPVGTGGLGGAGLGGGHLSKSSPWAAAAGLGGGVGGLGAGAGLQAAAPAMPYAEYNTHKPAPTFDPKKGLTCHGKKNGHSNTVLGAGLEEHTGCTLEDEIAAYADDINPWAVPETPKVAAEADTDTSYGLDQAEQKDVPSADDPTDAYAFMDVHNPYALPQVKMSDRDQLEEIDSDTNTSWGYHGAGW